VRTHLLEEADDGKDDTEDEGRHAGGAGHVDEGPAVDVVLVPADAPASVNEVVPPRPERVDAGQVVERDVQEVARPDQVRVGDDAAHDAAEDDDLKDQADQTHGCYIVVVVVAAAAAAVKRGALVASLSILSQWILCGWLPLLYSLICLLTP